MSNIKALQHKVLEIQHSLTEWCRQDSLFPKGTILTITVTHQPPPPVEVKIVSAYTRPTSGRGVQYNYSSELNEADWSLIFALPLSARHKRILERIKSTGNQGVTTEEMKAEGLPTTGEQTINKLFDTRRLPYRVRHPEPKSGENCRYGILVVLKKLSVKT